MSQGTSLAASGAFGLLASKRQWGQHVSDAAPDVNQSAPFTCQKPYQPLYAEMCDAGRL